MEDNAEVASVTAAILETMGYAVLRAPGTGEALQILEAQAVDLVFADIVMPGAMNGRALATVVRERFPSVGILLTSGYSEAGEDIGRDFAFLRKPFDAATLQAAVRSVLKPTGAGG